MPRSSQRMNRMLGLVDNLPLSPATIRVGLRQMAESADAMTSNVLENLTVMIQSFQNECSFICAELHPRFGLVSIAAAQTTARSIVELLAGKFVAVQLA